MKIPYGEFVRDKAIKNLISAQERIAEEGNAAEIMTVTKFILKASKKLDNQLLDSGFEKNEESVCDNKQRLIISRHIQELKEKLRILWRLKE